MLIPKRTKYRKHQKGRNRGIASSKTTLCSGIAGLKSLDLSDITAKQIEAARRVISRMVKKEGGKLEIRIFPDIPITRKPNEVRMGSGKGSVDHYVAKVKPGTILFELDGIDKALAAEALGKASYKLPIKTKIVYVEEA